MLNAAVAGVAGQHAATATAEQIDADQVATEQIDAEVLVDQGADA